MTLGLALRRLHCCNRGTAEIFGESLDERLARSSVGCSLINAAKMRWKLKFVVASKPGCGGMTTSVPLVLY